nr:DUF5302 domain-containing protein [Actinomycetales bacterium]
MAKAAKASEKGPNQASSKDAESKKSEKKAAKAAKLETMETELVEAGTELAEGPREAPAPAGHTEGDADAVKAKMRAALEKKKTQHHGGSAGSAQVKGPHGAAAGQQRRVFRRKSG